MVARWSDWLRRPTLARRLVLGLLLACGLVWGVVYAAGVLRMQYWEAAGFDIEMDGLAQGLRRAIESQPDAATLAAVLPALATFVGEEEQRMLGFQMRAFNIWRADGSWVAGSAAAPRLPSDLRTRNGYFDATLDGRPYRVLATWTSDGAYRIEALHGLAARRRAFDNVMLSPFSLLAPLLFLPLVLLPAWAAVRAGLRPMRQLSAELAGRPPGDLRPVSLPHVYAELEPMVREFNGTLARLRELLQRERDFLADAAHELRTPLAVIRAQCDALVHGGGVPWPEQAVQRLRVGVDRTSRLVNQLLALARLDAEVDDLPVTLDLADLVREALAMHESQARARRIELAYGGPESLRVTCRREAVESVLANLLGNAIRYGRPGGQVEVTLDGAGPEGLCLRVCDDGDGIAGDDRSRLFERFQRGRDVAASGAGLGLAIVASAARRLHARIDVTPGLGGRGVGFALTWPVDGAATAAPTAAA